MAGNDTENQARRYGGIDLDQFTCEKCGKQGVCVEGIEVFVAALCDECFWTEWKGYLQAVSGKEWTDEQARDALST